MFAQLLPVLKVVAPIATVSVMGGGVYYVATNMPRRANPLNLPGIYLLVKGEASGDVAEGKTLITTASSKTTKNYHCEITFADNKTAKDDVCALFKLNSLTGSNDLIDLNPKMFDDALLASEKGSVNTSSHHILRVSEEFYKKLSLTETTNKSIKLAETGVANKHFGTVKEITNLNLKKVSELIDPSINLFLARIKSPASSSTSWTAPTTNIPTPKFSCAITSTLSVGCNVYKLATGQEKNNALTKTNLGSITPIASHADVAAEHYVVVELSDKSIQTSDLKKQAISIKQIVTTPAATGNTQATKTTTEIANVVFDQALFGKASATASNSIIFPLTPINTSYLVKKGSTTGSFDSLTTSSTKNYRCQFTKGTDINYDNSCVLKKFPTSGNVHKYETILSPTSFTDVSGSISDKDHFLLTVDSRKLFNLLPNWKAEAEVSVVALSTTDAKSQPFTLLQEVTKTKATGKTKAVLVKYNSQAAVTGVSPTGKCALTDSDTTGVACTLKAATLSTDTISGFSATNSTDFASITKPAYFGVEFTEAKNITDFDGSSLFFYSTKDGTTTKITFDIVAALGGDLTTGKDSYYLEAPRAAISSTVE